MRLPGTPGSDGRTKPNGRRRETPRSGKHVPPPRPLPPETHHTPPRTRETDRKHGPCNTQGPPCDTTRVLRPSQVEPLRRTPRPPLSPPDSIPSRPRFRPRTTRRETERLEYRGEDLFTFKWAPRDPSDDVRVPMSHLRSAGYPRRPFWERPSVPRGTIRHGLSTGSGTCRSWGYTVGAE